MDDFAFDLDKALDELEEEEVTGDTFRGGHANPSLAQQLSNWPSAQPVLSTGKPSVSMEKSCSSSDDVVNNSHYAPHDRTICNGASEDYMLPDNQALKHDQYEPPVNLDLSEADFGPSITVQKTTDTPEFPSFSSGSGNQGLDDVDGAPFEEHLIISQEDPDNISVNMISSFTKHTDMPEKIITDDISTCKAEELDINIINKRDAPDGRCVVEPPHLDHVDLVDAIVPTTGSTSTCCAPDVITDHTQQQSTDTCTSSNTDSLVKAEPLAAEDISTVEVQDSPGESALTDYNHISNKVETVLPPVADLENSVSGQVDEDVLSGPRSIQEPTIAEGQPDNCDVDQTDNSSVEAAHPDIAEIVAHTPESSEQLFEHSCVTDFTDSTQSTTGANDGDITNEITCTEVVGFSADQLYDLDLSNEEMDQYLSTIGGPDNYTEFDAKPSLAAEILNTDPLHRHSVHKKQSDHVDLSPSSPEKLESSDDLEERRDSGGSLEKFLVPSVMSPCISTPIDDPGFSKVPGYVPDISATIIEETEEMDIDMVIPLTEQEAILFSEPCEPPHTEASTSDSSRVPEAIPSPDLRGARPKEQVRISRPNSLLGLSTPDLPSLTPPHSANEFQTIRDSGFVDDLRSSSGDDVNQPRSLPADINKDSMVVDDSSSARAIHDKINMQLAAQKSAPQLKKQLNLAIQQQVVLTDTKSTEQNSGSNAGTPVSHLPRPTTLGADMPPTASNMDHPSPAASQVPVAGQTSLPPVDTKWTHRECTNVSPAPEPSAGSSPRQKRPNSLSLSPRNVNQADLSGEDSPSPDYSDDVNDDADLAIEAADAAMAATGTPVTMRSRDMVTAGAVSPNTQNSEETDPDTAGAVGPVPAQGEAPPPSSANINLSITQLGKVAPVWIPDAEAPCCMECDTRFTFTKRRHHCRACGKVFCNSCCNLRSRIPHMENKEARVCSKCYQDLIRAQVYERMHQPSPRPNPNNPSTVNRRSEGPKQVMFSDGIRPGGDLTELDGADQRIAPQRSGRRTRRLDKNDETMSRTRVSRDQKKHVCLIPDQGLPPVLLSTGIKGDFSIEENPDAEKILPKIRSTDDPEPVVFAINKNLFVLVKILNLDCCVNRVCWCFTTKGMCTVGQDEIVIVLECLPDEKTIPRDIFCHFNAVYEEASKGNTVSHLGHTIFAQGFLDCRDHSGFLYINATYQCLQKLILPPQPYVFGILLQKWETPWAKVFPIRLMLRLGAEYRYYPCPLISVRFRKPVFNEIGHTIMNLLADFRNYQYMLPQVPGVTVHMEDKQTNISFPRNRYNNLMKVLANSNDHVMALGANFNMKADSHLVCLQNEEGSYQTQAINIQNKPRKITGASFVVFNGAFKQSGGLRAKSSIVEDGLMVQITAESMAELKEAMRNMTDYTIECGSVETTQSEEKVTVEWVEDDTNVNVGIKSPIDNMSMDGIASVRIHTSTDFVGEKHTVRWTEVFFIQTQVESNSRSDPVDLSRLAESLAHATCVALTPLLEKLQEAHLTKLALRATIDPDKVCYEVGSNGAKLPGHHMDAMDSALIPVIHSAANQNQDGPVVLELIFHIIE